MHHVVSNGRHMQFAQLYHQVSDPNRRTGDTAVAGHGLVKWLLE